MNIATIDDVEIEETFGGDIVIVKFRRSRRRVWRRIHLNAIDAMGVSNRLREAALRAFPQGKFATFNEEELHANDGDRCS
jgi:hypothetical protein